MVRAAKEAIIRYVTPTYAKLAKYLSEEYLPHSRPKVGLSSVPNGAAFYQALCNYHTTSPDLSPDQIHNIGLMEVARINKLMDGVRVKVGFNGKSRQNLILRAVCLHLYESLILHRNGCLRNLNTLEFNISIFHLIHTLWCQKSKKCHAPTSKESPLHPLNFKGNLNFH